MNDSWLKIAAESAALGLFAAAIALWLICGSYNPPV